MELVGNIPFSESQTSSPLVIKYIAKEESVRPLYERFPSVDNLPIQAKEKLANYAHRSLLCQQISKQYESRGFSLEQQVNFKRLQQAHTVTITTGHQLNLLTGPLYFFYKILEVIKTCEQANAKEDVHAYVPVFWLASEDHDFKEINHFYYKGKKILWDEPKEGPVGRLNLDKLSGVLTSFLDDLAESEGKEKLKKLLVKSYGCSATFGEASFALVNELFSSYGLLCIDGDDAILKQSMIPYFSEEISRKTSFKKITATNKIIGKKVQINPREINLFYIEDGLRERIVQPDLGLDVFEVVNTSLKFTEKELLSLLNKSPEKFSPNALLRPLYQEVLLPNVMYVGGGGEIAYWLQLKSFFESQKVIFPMLLVRNSVQLINEKEWLKMKFLNLDFLDFFQSAEEAVKSQIRKSSNSLDLLQKKEQELRAVFDGLEDLREQTHLSFGQMLDAQRKKQLNGFSKLKKRMLLAEAKNQEERWQQIEKYLERVKVMGALQERKANFTEYYIQTEKSFIKDLYAELLPFEQQFLLLKK